MSTISSVSSTSTSSTSSTSSSSSLDTDSFLQILAAELKYQDPSDPVSATEYVSQMAQNELTNISTAINNSSAYSLIGQEATYSTTDTSGNTVTGTGTVLSVTISGSNTYVNVDGTTVDYSSITQVGSDSTTTA